MRRIPFVVGLILLVVASTNATAQTRFSIEAGPLVPFGDFGDVVDGSAWIGARGEFQGVNALGQIAKLSIVVQAGYSDLELDVDTDASASLFAVGAGVRVYSVALPVFLHGGVEYSSTDLEFSAPNSDIVIDESSNAFGPTLGAGLNFGFGAVFVEVEGRMHVGIGGDGVDTRFTTWTAALGLPF